MRSITNLTRGPIRIPLPGGKVLHLGPNQVGSIREEHAEHPGLIKLCEAGTIELGEVSGGGAAAGTTPGGPMKSPAKR